MASKYADCGTEVRAWRGQLVRGLQLRPVRTWSFSYTDHTVTDGQRFDTLAEAFYGDPTEWYQIADANPEIFWWGDVEPGTVIRVPYV
ncbi:hypothetical protein ACWDTT_10555 [Streptosporangium sandarakinum]